jgi:dimethylamine/trimethylamine dehydrogenase
LRLPALNAMARDPRHDTLFRPITIGPKTLKNRFYQVPYSPGFGSDRPLARAQHRAVAAEGGWAAVNEGATAISPDWDISPSSQAVLWDDADARSFDEMCRAIHEHGALAGIELAHGGADAPNRMSRLPALAPSQLASWRRPHVTPKAMDSGDLRRLLREWDRAARLAASIGFDIVYVYGACSYLPAQFLSPFFNQRTDEYGGSLRNRARFWLEALEVVRDAIGDQCAIGTRIAVESFGPQGVSREETLEFVALADDLVDFWDFNVSADWARDSSSSRFFEEGYQLQWTGGMREATAKPIIGVGRLTSPDLMARIVESGAWDIIGAARPRLADPFLPRKIEEGRYDEIRECTGSNICIWSRHRNNITCFQNPSVGEEFRRGWHPERVPAAAKPEQDVLVVGGGVAGMECALVLARRGFRRIHLVEAAPDLGGSLRWVSTLPGLGEWARAINHRVVMLKKQRQVEVILRTTMSREDVLEYGAELVVVATGSRWAGDGVNGITHLPIAGAASELHHVLTPEQVAVEGKRPAGGRAIVYDADGYFVGPGLAELLAGQDVEVTLVTPFDRVSPFSDDTLEGALLREQLAAKGVAALPSTRVDEVSAGAVTLVGPFGTTERETDAVVLVTQRLSEEALYLQLKEREDDLLAAAIRGVYRIGDCVAPMLYADAIFDGHRLAREIDTDDPEHPLAPAREPAPERTVGWTA